MLSLHMTLQSVAHNPNNGAVRRKGKYRVLASQADLL